MKRTSSILASRARFFRLAFTVLTSIVFLACNLTGVLSREDTRTLVGLAATAQVRDQNATETQQAWAPMQPNATLDTRWAGGFAESECGCAGLPLDSATARADSLSCYYTWTVEDGRQELRQKIETMLTRVSDPNELAALIAAQGKVIFDLGGTYIREGETVFINTRSQPTGNTFYSHPSLYYGSLRAALDGKYMLTINLRGYDYSGEGQVESILRSLKTCMQAVIAD